MSEAREYACVGVCLPDEEEAYCLGCGRPWGNAPGGPPPEGGPESRAGATDDKVDAAKTAAIDEKPSLESPP